MTGTWASPRSTGCRSPTPPPWAASGPRAPTCSARWRALTAPAASPLILTGMGQDGLDGVREVRQAGGRVLAQDEASSIVFGMPGVVVAAGLADGGPSTGRHRRTAQGQLTALSRVQQLETMIEHPATVGTCRREHCLDLPVFLLDEEGRAPGLQCAPEARSTSGSSGSAAARVLWRQWRRLGELPGGPAGARPPGGGAAARRSAAGSCVHR